jgi:OmpA family
MRFFSTVFLLSAGILSANAQKVDCMYYFDSDVDTLSLQAESHVKNWAASHFHFRHDVLELRGHTDKNANDAYNELLSMRRAKRIEAILVEQGFDHIRLSYYGEKVPLCERDDEACLSTNRRVEVILYNEMDEKWMAAAHLVAPEVIFVNTTSAVTFEGANGTKFHLGLGNLLTPNGLPYFGPVRAEIREVLTPLDCIESKISTICNNRIIETGGMCEVHLYRASDNMPLNINGTFEIQFPSQSASFEEGMQTFQGVSTTDQLEWKPGDFEVLPYDLKWYLVEKKLNKTTSDWWPSGTGAPSTAEYPKSVNVYKCDTTWLSENEIIKKRARITRGNLLKNAIKSSNLGWINCDRFLQMENTVALKIVMEEKPLTAYIVLENRRVGLDYLYYPNVRIPANEPITIICMSDENIDGNIGYAVKRVTSSSEPVEVSLEWITPAELALRKMELDKLWL